jgi:hypothetical protein
MTNGRIVGEWGLDERISVGDDYPTCQLWAQQLFAAGFTGVYYHPRHDVARTSAIPSVALFGDPGRQAGSLKVLRSDRIPNDVLDFSIQQYGLKVLPPTALLPSFDPFGDDDSDERFGERSPDRDP